ncbi:MAG: type II secretion system F family protein [Pigmentiphaga sp.]
MASLALGASVFVAVALAAAFLFLEWKKGVALYQARFTESTTIRLHDLFLFLDARHWWRANLFLLGMAAVAGGGVSRHWLGAVLAGGLALWAPRQLYRTLQRRRWRQIDAQIPDALLTLASALRAGISVMSALRQLVDLSPLALRQELGLMMKENRVGIGLEEALMRLEQRLPLPSVQLWSAAMRVSAETGGNLAEVLERLALTLRQQRFLEARMEALTAQGRLQARVLLMLPWLVALAMTSLNPSWMQSVWLTPAGKLCMVLIGFLQLAGWWSIRRIVQVKG